MSGSGDDKKVEAAAAIANSKAAEKLADAVSGLVQLPRDIVDYIVGPKRIASVGAAKAGIAVAEAQAKADIARIRAQTADYVLDREMRKTLNREAIVAEAQAALPPPETKVSEEPVSKDFVHVFFEEFDGISDPEVHKIAGRLLAGEITKPGSFPRRTLRVLRDLEPEDFKAFRSLCRFAWHASGYKPAIYDTADAVYKSEGVNFSSVKHLEALGLLSFADMAHFYIGPVPDGAPLNYGTKLIRIKTGVPQLNVGKVLLTEAGEHLAPLTQPDIVPGFVDFLLAKWKSLGIDAEVLGEIAGEG